MAIVLSFTEAVVLFYTLFCHASMGAMRHELIQHCCCRANRHALKNDSAGAFHSGVEEAFTAEEHVLKSFDGTDFHGAALAHGRQIACIDDLAGELVHEHVAQTASPLAARILADWSAYRPKFVKVTPIR